MEPQKKHQFCCSGCRVAYQVIHEQGLHHYYDLKQRTGATTEAATGRGASFEEFDDPAFTDLYCQTASSGLSKVDLYLEGVHCAACVWLVEKTPSALHGVADCRLDLGRARATVLWDREQARLSDVARFLDSIGYTPHPYQGVDAQEVERREQRQLLIRLGVSGALAGNIMMLAFALYGGFLYGMARDVSQLFRWTSLLLALPAVLWCALPFYRGAWGALRTRSLHMDVPIAVGILAGFGWGLANTLRNQGEIYFDSVSLLVFLLLSGRYLQQRQQRHAARSAELLFALSPSSARLIADDEGVRTVPVATLRKGDLVELRSGDSVPADGVVHEGSSTLDLSLLTGESRPVPVNEGDPVHAGTLNLSARLVVRVERTGEETRVGRLLNLVEESIRRRPRVVRMADRLSGYFVATALGLALITAALWWGSSPDAAMEHAVALLIVTCPCALGLATPLAVSAAIGQAARAGFLVKGGDALEALSRPGVMLVDKTGTLTEGRFEVVRWLGDRGVRPLLAAAEARSSHPVARALSSVAVGDLLPVPDQVHVHPGKGLEADFGEQRLLAGSASFVSERLEGLSGDTESALASLRAEALTPVLVALNGKVVALAGCGDPLRSDSRGTLAAIQGLGWQVQVLSGDDAQVTRAVAHQVGLPAESARGGVSPEGRQMRCVTSWETAPWSWWATASTTPPLSPKQQSESPSTAVPKPPSPPPTSTSPNPVSRH